MPSAQVATQANQAATKATEEVTRLALPERSSSSVAMSKEAVTDLRHDLRGIADALKMNAVDAAATNAEASAAILKELRNMGARMERMETSAAERDLAQRANARLRRFQSAFVNIAHCDFRYYLRSETAQPPLSSLCSGGTLLSQILTNAMRGYGTYIGEGNFSRHVLPVSATRNYFDVNQDAKAVTAFHSELSDALLSLTGEPPVLICDEGRYLIRFNAV